MPDIPIGGGNRSNFDKGVVWVAQDQSEEDDVSVKAFAIAANNIAKRDNIFGDEENLEFEGVLIDSVKNPTRNATFKAAVEEAGQALVDENGELDVFGLRDDLGINGIQDGNAFTSAFERSLEDAFNNDEQVIILSGGPTLAFANIFEDFIQEGDSAAKAAWALRGGFIQVSHGGFADNDDDLEANEPNLQNPPFNFEDQNGNPVIFDRFRELKELAESLLSDEDIAELAQDNELVEDFILQLDNQNNNSAVRSNAGITDNISDPTTRRIAEAVTPDDLSDLGLLGVIAAQEGDEGFREIDEAQVREFTTPSAGKDEDNDAGNGDEGIDDNDDDGDVAGDNGQLTDIFDAFIVDTVTNERVVQLQEGIEVNSGALPNQASIALFARDNGSDFDSITLDIDGDSRTEAVEPFALFGDLDGDFLGGRTFDVGSQTLSVALNNDNQVTERLELDFEIV